MLQTIKEMPIIIDVRKVLFEKKFSTHQNVNYFRGVFENFTEARLSSPKTKPIGYDNEPAAKLYRERISRLHTTDYPVLFWMKHFLPQTRAVFDFGGHIGIHYYSYSKVLDFSSIDRWTVCDVESVTRAGEMYASRQKGNKLKFVNDIKKCTDYDLFLASGSLQYLEWELHEKLQELPSLPKFLLINMLPLHPVQKTITLQSIGTSFCPYYLRIESDFIDGLVKLGYEVVDIWKNEEKQCNIAFEKERSLNYYRGMALKLKIH